MRKRGKTWDRCEVERKEGREEKKEKRKGKGQIDEESEVMRKRWDGERCERDKEEK